MGEESPLAPELERILQPLKRCEIFSYGVGHMLNDITAACWFTYLLIFLTEIGLHPRDAAIVMLSGQVADGIMTILAGQLIDRFGHFKLWHIGGSVLVAVSFSSVFGGCILCSVFNSYEYSLQVVSYSIAAAVFNIGWAATQVSHMAMVNCMTFNKTSRVCLASCRNAFTMVANLTLYGIAYAVFSLISSKTCADVVIQFRWIAYTGIAIGSCFLVAFLAGTKEPEVKLNLCGCDKKTRISCFFWFKKLLYYQVGLVYMLSRLVTNVSQALLAFYVTRDLGMDQYSKATIPALIFVFSCGASVILQEMKWSSARLKNISNAGAVLWMVAGVAAFALPGEMHNWVYLLSVVIGVANAMLTVASVGMEGVLVDKDIGGCAFVYGSLSFLDKLSCGIALFILESYQDSTPCPHDATNFFSASRFGTGLLPAIFAFLSLLATSTTTLPEHDDDDSRTSLSGALLP